MVQCRMECCWCLHDDRTLNEVALLQADPGKSVVEVVFR